MTMTKERKSTLFVTIIACMILWALCAGHAQAASKKTLTTGKTYKIDITGDNKTEKIKLVPSQKDGEYYFGLDIYVNGKLRYTATDTELYGCNYFEGAVLTTNSGKNFLYIAGFGDDGDGINQVLFYDTGKKTFRVVADLSKYFLQYGNHFHLYDFTVDSLTVEKNKIAVHAELMSYTLGVVDFKVSYNYTAGTLKQAVSLNLTKKTWTANKKITVYKNNTCTKNSFTIKKGQKVQILKMSYKNGQLAIKVKANGKKGWIAASKEYLTKKVFKEVRYAG